MHQALLIGVAVGVSGLVLGWILRASHHAPRLAEVLHFGGSAFVRLLAAFVLGWSAAVLLEHPNALHIGAAVLLSVMALWTALTAALTLYVVVTGSADRSNGANEPS